VALEKFRSCGLLMFSDRQFLIDVFQKQQRICPLLDVIGLLNGVGAKRPKVKKLGNGVTLKHNSSTRERRVSDSRGWWFGDGENPEMDDCGTFGNTTSA